MNNYTYRIFNVIFNFGGFTTRHTLTPYQNSSEFSE